MSFKEYYLLNEEFDESQINSKKSHNLRLYHVSPKKFDKFSLDFVGNSNGDMFYGFGVYFTNRIENTYEYLRFIKSDNKYLYTISTDKDFIIDNNVKIKDTKFFNSIKNCKYYEDYVSNNNMMNFYEHLCVTIYVDKTGDDEYPDSWTDGDKFQSINYSKIPKEIHLEVIKILISIGISGIYDEINEFETTYCIWDVDKINIINVKEI